MFASNTSFSLGPNNVILAIDNHFVIFVARVEFPLEFNRFLIVDDRLA
jgi:hypothetical protein